MTDDVKPPRKKKYNTPEEKLEADRRRKREWARRNKDNVIRLSYDEIIAKMTEEEYVSFLKRKSENQRKYRENKK